MAVLQAEREKMVRDKQIGQVKEKIYISDEKGFWEGGVMPNTWGDAKHPW